MTTLLLRIIFDEDQRLGPGKIALLEAIASTGSISGAARGMGMSYRRAWVLLDAMNTMFSEPVAETSHGGLRGGGAHLTPFGRQVIDRYRGLEDAFRQTAAGDVAFFEQHLQRGAR